MKNRAERMQKIFKLAKAEERRVAEEMGRVQRSLNAEINRLQELESYRQNYTAQFKSSGTISAARWQDYQNFLERIDRAVDGQKEQIVTGRETRDVQRRRWMMEKQKLDSLGRVVDRFRKAEKQAADRRSQKVQDDLTATGRFSKPRSLD